MLFLAMDFIDGTDLREIIARDGALAPERAVAILAQVTSALDAAHHNGLVHRDVKPANILIAVRDGREHAYLTDFGLAKRSDNATAVTSQGAVVGTVDYMPPEQITGDATDARTDIYALGCVFFQMLTGKIPYQRDNSVATLFAHVHDAPPSLVGPVAAAHPTLGPVIARAMAKSPADRYLSAGDFGRDARAALEGTRFTGPPTIVATGEARLETAAPTDPALERVWPVPDVAPTRASTPQTPPETPARAPETAARTPEAPSFVPETPARAPETAARTPEAPSFVPETPARAPETAARTPEAPSFVPETPARAPETAARTPEAPSFVPETPARAPEAPSRAAAGAGSRSAGAAPSRRRRWPIVAGVGLLAAALIAAIVIISGSSSSNAAGEPFASKLNPVPTNRVTGSGTASVTLDGDVATVRVSANGLLNGAPHLMHIHAGGEGICPPASAATLHNGHLSMSTTNAGRYYGSPVVSLTTVGDTSPRSIIDFTRYPVGGRIRYRRTISLPPSVVTDIRENNAVIIVHGIDYNGNGVYDGYLGTSDLSNSLTEESTDPALCGPLAAATTVAGVRSAKPSVYTALLTVNEVLSRPGAMSDMDMGRMGGARAMSMPGMSR
jgi:hypothetical protein